MILAPKPTHRIVDARGNTDAIWLRWASDLTEIANNAVTRDILAQAIADALGETTSIALNGSSTISVTGNAADGYNINLRELADSGVGAALVKTTRDKYGRTSGQQDATAADLPYDNTASGLDAEQTQAAIDELSAEKLDDAPSDGAGYVRKDGAWAAESGGAVSSVNGQTGAVVLGGESIAEPVNVLTPSAGVVNIDCALGDYFTLAPTANVTSITFSNLPASGKAQTIMVRFTQDTTPRTLAWPASFKWEGGVAGGVSTGSGAIDVLALTTFNQGTTWIATLAKAFA